ncbi:MAG TPA: rod shape-determining protein [Clostridia bacterium]|nr:rod shape-determining protein [Clostridia bacterium]
MFKSKLLGLFAPSIAIDLGTVNTLIAIKGRGIVLREPSAVAVSAGKRREILAVGKEAIQMLGRTPGGINVIYPMRDGVVADFELTATMLRFYMEKALGRRIGMLGVRLMLCLPMCVTGVERRALLDAAKGAGANEVMLMDEPMAAAIGADLPVYDAVGSMIVDIGGGTTDVAVIALGGVASYNSVRTGGVHIDAAIIAHVAREYNVAIGERTAEDIKKTIGSAVLGGTEHMEIRGRNRETGLPESLVITSSEINRAIMQPLREIVEAVKTTLASTPPELAGDVMEHGIALSGGGALLKGIDLLIARETGVRVGVAQDAFDCVALGALLALSDLSGITSVLEQRTAEEEASM